MKVTDDYVFFWGDEPFTNFTPCPNLRYLGIDWKSTEQAFMWIKAVTFKDFDTAQKIRKAETPKEAKKLGRSVKNFKTDIWSKESYNHMKQLVDIKFRTNPEFMAALLNPSFDGKTFVEASPYDKIWGIGFRAQEAAAMVAPGDRERLWGENKLGKILTELREVYKKSASTKLVSIGLINEYNARNKTRKEKEVDANTAGVVGKSNSR